MIWDIVLASGKHRKWTEVVTARFFLPKKLNFLIFYISRCSFVRSTLNLIPNKSTYDNDDHDNMSQDCVYYSQNPFYSDPSGVNFINILHKHFLYESTFLAQKFGTKALRAAL